jgi:EAL domain-containing protein (putative c-di-GMP-specific phosphodiesterase class I)
MLRELGCEGMQGYLFGKPMAPADCEVFLRGSLLGLD